MSIEDPHVGQRVRRIRHMSPLRPQRGTIRNVYGFDWANLTDEDVEVEWDEVAWPAEERGNGDRAVEIAEAQASLDP